MNPYALTTFQNARKANKSARAKFQAGLGQAKTAGLVAAGAYGAARLSAHMGGPSGKKIGGVDLPLAAGGACALVAMSGWAGDYSDELLALGVGAIAGYAAQKGFDAGMKSHKPEATVSGEGDAYATYAPTGYIAGEGAAFGVGADHDDPDRVIRQFATASDEAA